MGSPPKFGEGGSYLKDTVNKENVIGVTSGHFEVRTGNTTINYYGRQYTDPGRPQQHRPSDSVKRNVSDSAPHADQHATNGMNPTAQSNDGLSDTTSAAQHGFGHVRPPYGLRPLYDYRDLYPPMIVFDLLWERAARANRFEREFGALWDRAAHLNYPERDFRALWDRAALVDYAAREFRELWDHAALVDWRRQHPANRHSFSPSMSSYQPPFRGPPFDQGPITSESSIHPNISSHPEISSARKHEPPRLPSPTMRTLAPELNSSNERTPLLERPQQGDSTTRPWYHKLWPCSPWAKS